MPIFWYSNIGGEIPFYTLLQTGNSRLLGGLYGGSLYPRDNCARPGSCSETVIILPIFLMAHESIVNLTSDNYTSEAEGASVPVVIDFWSEHCGPCKMLAPVLDEVAAEIGDTAKVAKVDVMAERELAMKFAIRAVPTLVFMKDGDVKETKTGIMMKDAIIEKLNSL